MVNRNQAGLTRRPGSQKPENFSPSVVDPAAKSAEKTNGSHSVSKEATPLWVMIALAIIAVISIVTIPEPFQPHGEPTNLHVFYYGWLTALSTGLGVLPFIFIPEVPPFWVGVCNGKSKSVIRWH